MEDDKKKKRNKGKKNKQGEATDDVSVSGNGQVSQAAGDVHSDDASSVGNGQVSEAGAGARSDAVRDGDGSVNGKRHESSGTESRLLAESEKKWLQREATLQETIKHLQIEKDVYIQKEATLKDSVKKLRNENHSRIQKEATLHDTIKQMRDETDSHTRKEAGLQVENEHLQSEKVLWLQKEVGLEDKIGRLVDEKGTLHSEKVTYTTEAEFIAAASSACQAVWLRRILEQLNHGQYKPTVIHCDNVSAIKLSKNPVMHGRSKHIDVRFHFLRNLVKDEVVELVQCSTQEQIADILTKPLRLEVFVKMRDLMGIYECPGVGLEDKIGRLVDEKGTLHSEKTSLQEKFKHLEGDRETWTLKEDAFKGTLATLNDDIARLRALVSELEQSRNNLVQENQQLMENISSLQLQIKNLGSVYSTPASDEIAKASEHEELNSQVEAACSLVEKLVAENTELVEKVNELYGELDRRSLTVELASTTESSTPVVPPEAASVIDPVSLSTEDTSTSDEKLDSPKVVPIKQEMHSNGNVDSEHAALVPELPVSDEVSEIVQIPLDENSQKSRGVSRE